MIRQKGLLAVAVRTPAVRRVPKKRTWLAQAVAELDEEERETQFADDEMMTRVAKTASTLSLH